MGVPRASYCKPEIYWNLREAHPYLPEVHLDVTNHTLRPARTTKDTKCEPQTELLAACGPTLMGDL